MDSWTPQFIAYELFLDILPKLIIFFISVRVFSNYFNNLKGKYPPIIEGVPFIGGVIKIVQGPTKMIMKCYNQRGEIFTVPMGHKRLTFLIGPTASAHFYKASDEELSQKEVYGFNVPTFGKGVVFDVDHIVRGEQFRMFTDALKSNRLKGYIPQFALEAEEFFQKWGDQGKVDMTKEMEQLITLTASRTLLGKEARDMFNEVSNLIHYLDQGMQPISVLLPYLPTKAHRKRDWARKQLGSIFQKILDDRRKNNRKEHDLLQHFMDSKYQKVYNGRQLNNEEVVGMLIAAIFAGQHTSNVTTSWTIYYLIENKSLWKRCVEEQKQVVQKFGPELTDEALSEMTFLHFCIKEALRLQPPLIMLMRYVQYPFRARTSNGKEYTIPKGDIIAVSPAFANRLPDVFKKPEAFDPTRYLEPRSEDKQQFSHVSFGAGRHGCLGTNFAYLQIKAVMSFVLRNFQFEFIDKFPEPNLDAMIQGPKSCHITYKKVKFESM